MDKYTSQNNTVDKIPYYNKNKKRTIDKVLSGSSTHISIINKWNITWIDLLDVNNDTSSVKLYIKNYLNPQIDEQKCVNFENTTTNEKIPAVFFNRKLNLYNIKKDIYGVMEAISYISNICHNITKHNILDWLNDPDIMGDCNPITHLGYHQYDVYVDKNIVKKMTLKEIENICNYIIIDSVCVCINFILSTELKSFDPSLDDSFYNLYCKNDIMISNPYDKIIDIKTEKYTVTNKCKIGIQSNKLSK
jgi:hypothetical protein